MRLLCDYSLNLIAPERRRLLRKTPVRNFAYLAPSCRPAPSPCVGCQRRAALSLIFPIWSLPAEIAESPTLRPCATLGAWRRRCAEVSRAPLLSLTCIGWAGGRRLPYIELKKCGAANCWPRRPRRWFPTPRAWRFCACSALSPSGVGGLLNDETAETATKQGNPFGYGDRAGYQYRCSAMLIFAPAKLLRHLPLFPVWASR